MIGIHEPTTESLPSAAESQSYSLVQKDENVDDKMALPRIWKLSAEATSSSESILQLEQV